MDILSRKSGARWEKVQEHQFESEGRLQDLLYGSPEVIPVASLGGKRLQPKLFVKEAGLPGSGNSDLIGIDEEGGITIIECKLATNPEIRRKVIGQVLEYASYLWGMPYDSFDQMCCHAENWQLTSLAAEMEVRIAGTSEQWSRERFVAAVEATLNAGDFSLIIAVDRITHQLKRTIEFMDSKERGGAHVCALEMTQYALTGFEILVPRLYGTPSVDGPSDGMNERRLLLGASRRFDQLYRGLRELALTGHFGHSAFSKRGYVFRLGDSTNIAYLRPNYLQMWLQTEYRPGVVDETTNAQFWSTVGGIRAFSSRPGKKNPEMVVSDETWSEDEVDMFLDAVRIMGESDSARS